LYNVDEHWIETEAKGKSLFSNSLSLPFSFASASLVYKSRWIGQKDSVFISSIIQEEDATAMTLDPFFRRMSMMAGVFAFIGVILGVIALATNYWTMENVPSSGMAMSNGTMPMNENFDWTWNVSSHCRQRIFSTMFSFRVYFTHVHLVIRLDA
jgi:hypothetical protein